jgi:hypothetical protein
LLPLPFSGHLWFMQHLFLIVVLTLPLLLWLGSGQGRRVVVWLAGRARRRAGLLLFVAPLAVTLVALRGLFAAQRSWADFVWYALYFAIGFILAMDSRFTGAIKRQLVLGPAMWFIGIAVVGALVLALGYDPIPGRETYSVRYGLYQVGWAVGSWGAVASMLGLGVRFLNRPHRLLGYATEAVLPFYLLHQTVILCVGFFVVRWDVPIAFKLPVVAVVSFTVIAAVYGLLVRRWSPLRILFGMRRTEGTPK